VTGVFHLGQPCVEGGAHGGGWILGAQFEPCPKPWLVIVWCLVGELDAEAAAVGEADDEHRLGYPGVVHGGDRTAPEGGLEAPSQILPPVWLGEKVCIAAKSGHGLSFLAAGLA
jgi:hypothetical protein